mgnify:CR=1 FL=1
MEGEQILGQLNDPQKEAVTSGKQPILVVAGAGSGKTRVLVHKIAWLIGVESVSPHSILAVTFTNKAANEMLGDFSGRFWMVLEAGPPPKCRSRAEVSFPGNNSPSDLVPDPTNPDFIE